MLSDGPLADIAASAGPLPLAVSVDEEGGRVSRLSSADRRAAVAAGAGADQDPRTRSTTSRCSAAQAMRNLGITIDFAPVVDVTDAPDDDGDRRPLVRRPIRRRSPITRARTRRVCATPACCRCSSTSPATATARATRTPVDVVTPPLADLQNNDLVPYRTLTTAGARRASWSGHMQVPGLTGSDPASLSPAAYGLLRSGDYGGPPFDGPVFTDDLSSMAAISDQRYGVAEAVLRSLQAGADVALWVTTDEVPAVLDRLEKAVAAGELPHANGSTTRCCGGAVKGPNPRCGPLIASRIAYPGVSTAAQEGTVMAGGTKRLPRAVREQQMLDAAVQMFSVNGYHETSMDAIAAAGRDLQADAVPLLRLQGGAVRRVPGPRADPVRRRRARRHRLQAEPEGPAAQRGSRRS